jgi:CheY-like chemotaxis protein
MSLENQYIQRGEEEIISEAPSGDIGHAVGHTASAGARGVGMAVGAVAGAPKRLVKGVKSGAAAFDKLMSPSQWFGGGGDEPSNFEKDTENQSIPNPDYLAICWLVDQKYISHVQAALLIEKLALEVLQPLLNLEYGSYEFVPHTFLDNLPKFCHLNLRTLVEQSQSGVKVDVQENLNFENDYQSYSHKKHQEQLPGSNADQVDSEANINQPNNPQVRERKKYSILGVDDDYSILNAVEDFLDEQIFSVLKFMDSSQALMEILRVQPDIILLNIEMPNLDGFEICSLLRKHTHYQNIPVILMTEKMGLKDRAKAKFVRANGYLEKPFSQGDLLKIIFQHIV